MGRRMPIMSITRRRLNERKQIRNKREIVLRHLSHLNCKVTDMDKKFINEALKNVNKMI